jgi:hypothetical protein
LVALEALARLDRASATLLQPLPFRWRDAQSDPGARLGLSIACTALDCPPSLRANAVATKTVRMVASNCRADLRPHQGGPDRCAKRPSPGPEVSSKSFTLYVEPSRPSCLASTGHYSWRPTLLIKQPAHQGPRALPYRRLHFTEPQIARHGPSPAFCTPALRTIGGSGRLPSSTLRQARKTGTAESKRRFDLARGDVT